MEIDRASKSKPAAAGAEGPIACAHCGLPVPDLAPSDRAPPEGAFCCEGCRAAYAIIHSCGLERYYELRRSAGAEGRRPASGSRSYAELDDDAFHATYVERAGEGLRSVELFLENIHCSACVWLVEKLPNLVPGVLSARLDFRRALVRVTWREDRARLSDAARALSSLGYPPHPARDRRQREARRLDDRRQMIRIAVAGACAGNVMLLALALYAGVFDEMARVYRELFRWTSMGITLVCLAWPGMVFFRGALASLRVRTIGLDVPISLGLLAGLVWSVLSTIRGHGDVYFDSLALLVFLLLVGRFVQSRQQRAAGDSVELLFSLTPSVARRRDGSSGQFLEVPLEAVAVGDVVEVRAGECIPVDGEVLEGESAIDASVLTGESRPSRVVVGDDVPAGAVNFEDRLLITTSATGARTRLGRLMAMVEEGTRQRAPIVQLADRTAAWFVVGMATLAGLTLALWWGEGVGVAIEHASALLIVTCPCALGLATPMTMTVALGRAARAGMLVKGGESIERLGRPGLMVLDKTGTITHGRMCVVEWIGDESLRGPVAALEGSCSHPIARALSASDVPAASSPVEVVHTAGSGIEGRVGGRTMLVGSRAFVARSGIPIPAWAEEGIARAIAGGRTCVLACVEGRVEGVAVLGDQVRADSAEAIERLRGRGWTIRIASGDDPAVVARVGEVVGVGGSDALGGLRPEEKASLVRDWSRAREVVMVGDGVNDAAALATAGVGIAVHGGAEASLSASDVYLNRPGIMPIVELVESSGRTMGVIRRNLWVSLGYNALAAGLCVAGLINPIVAAIIMPMSSLSVVALSVRSRTFGGDR